MPRAVWRVTRAANAFLAVLRLTEVNSTKHWVSQGHQSIPSDCEILVTHLATRDDFYFFGQVRTMNLVLFFDPVPGLGIFPSIFSRYITFYVLFLL